MEINKQLSVPCIKVTQPIGDFYICSIDSIDLCEITKFDIRRIHKQKGFETYLGIQRPLSDKRIKEIKQYVNTIDASFPTSIILAVSGNCAEYNEDARTLKLFPFLDVAEDEENIPYEEIAVVIDGQHRIEGLREWEERGKFQISVTIFVDIDIANQAYIFSMVNLTQTKVNRSLVSDLFAFAKERSPQKTCHNIAVALDKIDYSPFYQKIKRLGVATEGRFNETINQATFVNSLMTYISKNPVEDRDRIIRSKPLIRADAKESQKLIFRNMFIDDLDLDISEVILNYFLAVAERWPEAWNFSGRGLMLNKTNGFKALFRFLKPAYLYLTAPPNVPKIDDFLEIFEKINMHDKQFNIDQFKPGSSGESSLYRSLLELSGIPI